MSDAQRAAEVAPFQPIDWGFLLGAAGIWGSSFLFTEIALEAFKPGLVTFGRVGFGCLTLWLLPYDRTPVPREAWPRIALLGFLWMAFPLTLFPLAQQWIDSVITGMLNSGMPVAALVAGVLLFSARPGRIQIVGVVVGLIGIALIGAPEASGGGTTAAGIGLVLLAVGCYGVAANLAGPLQREYGAVPVVRLSLTVAMVLTLPWGAIDATRSSFGWGPFFALLAMGALGTGVAYIFAAQLTGRVGAVRMSIVTYLIPIVSTVLGVVFRDEPLTLLAVVGTVVVLAGAYLTTRQGSST